MKIKFRQPESLIGRNLISLMIYKEKGAVAINYEIDKDYELEDLLKIINEHS